MESKIVSTLTSRTLGKSEWYLNHSESPGLRWHGDVACGFGLERERYGRPSTLEKAAVVVVMQRTTVPPLNLLFSPVPRRCQAEEEGEEKSIETDRCCSGGGSSGSAKLFAHVAPEQRWPRAFLPRVVRAKPQEQLRWSVRREAEKGWQRPRNTGTSSGEQLSPKARLSIFRW
ncbi:hypothetical protein HZH66_000828 [Vespula vulgaris]|uniref:Uncharacterized protein n=1 Tax=Vespula vulgaris TaxID=7454 RepID=A0A834NJQ3_VESVU|nr:hypothetical protein HZH66_000828 [Vespula vulgaris]